MCAHFTFIPKDELADIIRTAQANLAKDKAEEPEQLTFGMSSTPGFDIFPGREAPVLLPAADKLCATFMTWGFPHWEDKKKLLHNTRLDAAAGSRFWRDAFSNRRCLIPATVFYEWNQEQKKREVGFALPEEQTIYIAGIYQEFNGVSRFSVITTEPNTTVAAVHNRMPLVLLPEEHNIWLFGDAQPLHSRHLVKLNKITA